MVCKLNCIFNDIIANTDFEAEDLIKNTLVEILHQAYKQNPSFLTATGFTIQTELTFPRNWGLGTFLLNQSTLHNGYKLMLFSCYVKVLW